MTIQPFRDKFRIIVLPFCLREGGGFQFPYRRVINVIESSWVRKSLMNNSEGSNIRLERERVNTLLNQSLPCFLPRRTGNSEKWEIKAWLVFIKWCKMTFSKHDSLKLRSTSKRYQLLPDFLIRANLAYSETNQQVPANRCLLVFHLALMPQSIFSFKFPLARFVEV